MTSLVNTLFGLPITVQLGIVIGLLVIWELTGVWRKNREARRERELRDSDIQPLKKLK